jgi:hypothetical protein
MAEARSMEPSMGTFLPSLRASPEKTQFRLGVDLSGLTDVVAWATFTIKRLRNKAVVSEVPNE